MPILILALHARASCPYEEQEHFTYAQLKAGFESLSENCMRNHYFFLIATVGNEEFDFFRRSVISLSHFNQRR